MARPRSKSGGYYAWSDLYNGGETEKRSRANGREMTVVLSRNVIERGQAVSQSDLGLSDDEWEALVESGSVRDYPLPESADEYTSPSTAIVRSLVDDRGDIDVNKLMQLGLAHPPAANPPAGEQAEIPEGA